VKDRFALDDFAFRLLSSGCHSILQCHHSVGSTIVDVFLIDKNILRSNSVTFFINTVFVNFSRDIKLKTGDKAAGVRTKVRGRDKTNGVTGS
jgi:hypothetical protein